MDVLTAHEALAYFVTSRVWVSLAKQEDVTHIRIKVSPGSLHETEGWKIDLDQNDVPRQYYVSRDGRFDQIENGLRGRGGHFRLRFRNTVPTF